VHHPLRLAGGFRHDAECPEQARCLIFYILTETRRRLTVCEFFFVYLSAQWQLQPLQLPEQDPLSGQPMHFLPAFLLR
jgi:hypothetical protein